MVVQDDACQEFWPQTEIDLDLSVGKYKEVQVQSQEVERRTVSCFRPLESEAPKSFESSI